MLPAGGSNKPPEGTGLGTVSPGLYVGSVSSAHFWRKVECLRAAVGMLPLQLGESGEACALPVLFCCSDAFWAGEHRGLG